MDSCMFSKFSWISKRFFAIRTRKRSFPCMHSNVCFQVGWKQFIAIFAKLVFDSGFTRVHFMVFPQTIGLRKRFTTLITFEGSFSCMHFVLSLAELLRTFPQSSQGTNLSFPWTSLWLFRCDEVANLLLHSLHTYGLSLVCILLWFLIWLQDVKSCLHWEHLYGLSSVCAARLWAKRLSEWE